MRIHGSIVLAAVAADVSAAHAETLTAGDGATWDNFGQAVSVSADGCRVLVGSLLDDVDGHEDQGSAYVFVRSSSGWVLEQKLVAADGIASGYFGESVSLSSDGSRALIGAPAN